ncbi:MAG TPA: Sec-independent protein translocase protein TatB [Nitriliruptorales bacterium]|nr:Sec-independent protein translocase protein TatB [Nitriliruptorales bacterium]
MGNIGFQELLVIAVLAMLVFGPDRLPEIARQAGKFLSRFREETSRSVAELKRAAEVQDLDRELKAVRSQLRQTGRQLTGSVTGGSGAAGPPGESPPPTDPEAT